MKNKADILCLHRKSQQKYRDKKKIIIVTELKHHPIIFF